MTKCQHYSLELDSTAARHAHKQNVADWGAICQASYPFAGVNCPSTKHAPLRSTTFQSNVSRYPSLLSHLLGESLGKAASLRYPHKSGTFSPKDPLGVQPNPTEFHSITPLRSTAAMVGLGPRRQPS